MKLVIATSLAALALGAIAPAIAQNAIEVVVTGRKVATPGAEARTKTINYGDLDLSKSAGLSTLLKRIKGAAVDVCAPAPAANDIAGSKDYKNCMSSAVNSAVAQVNNPGLKEMVASSK